MKRFVSIMLLSILVLATGCAPMPPFDVRPETPNLSIATSQIRPVKTAIVVQDPMPYTLFYRGQGNYRRDMTAESRAKGFMLERDLSKVVSDTLSQAFNQVVVLRDLPQPGQYDLVVNLNIEQIMMQERVIVTGETCDVTAEWKMSVLDNQNRELLDKRGVSPKHNFKWSAMNPSHDFVLGINSTLSLILSELAKEWGATLSKLDIPTAKR